MNNYIFLVMNDEIMVISYIQRTSSTRVNIGIEGNKGLASVFGYDLDPERILRELGSVVRGREIVPGRTLLIFDEIQACPNAVTSLKYFCESNRELHIACAGSLLGVLVKWVDTHNFEEVSRLQDNILADYGSDFAKHAPKTDIPKLGWIWDSIPKQLARGTSLFLAFG